MTTLDIIILIIFVVSVALGFKRGIIVQVGAIGGILLGVVLCHIGDDWLASIIAGGNGTPSYVDNVLATIILFIVGYLSARAIAHFFKQASHALQLGALDRIGGVIFSLFQWMLILSILLNLWTVIKPTANICAHSTLAGGKAIAAIVRLAPDVLGWALGG